MGAELKGRRVAILATDGVEESELVEPRKVLEAAGAETHLVAPEAGEIQAFRHLDKGARLAVDRTLDAVSAADYDALLLPGGVANPDALRTNRMAVSFVRAFLERDRTVAAICHAPWLLVEADAVRGRTLTSWPSLRTDIQNAGGTWVDEEVQVDQTLITSRKPEDVPAFAAKLVTELARAPQAGADEAALDRMVEQTFPASDPLPGPTHVGDAR
ncbi:MAG TPA: type 1 glutamine amidotransferase domain-containing protein [Gemmatimonadaceae bacterium]|nr:type 1 glutamine amidotransferase domain-containing protein [Gemmatimonadaceae bacterium]